MPCYNEGEAEGRAAEAKRFEGWATHNSPPAEMLCMILKNVEDAGLYSALLDALPGPFHREKVDKWFRDHKARDAKIAKDI